jgi:phosphatidylserine/phosphatidylglycerophosphate/cardiolipin synthase-like enzyme
MIVIESRELAANYTDEFNEMFEKKRFGPNKDKGVPNPVVQIDGTRIETVFAAQGPVEERIIATLRGAQRSISFLAFSFTDDEIAGAMLDRRAAGVALAGVFETTGSNTEFSEFGKMKERGVPVYQDGNPWVMHHKVIIIDERIVIFGSYNFSNNAATQNDENLLIVENPDIARAFKAEYDRILALAQNPPPKKR